MLCQHAACASGPLSYCVCLCCTERDLKLSRVLPGALNDTLSVKKKKNHIMMYVAGTQMEHDPN